MKHLYRKAFNHAFEAEETAKGFSLMPGIIHTGPVEVSTGCEGGKHWVYVAFEGEFDAEDLFAATGYQRVT